MSKIEITEPKVNLIGEISSGNIHLTLSEHFSQFASVNRSKIDIRKFVRNCSKIIRKMFVICKE